jgi:hypothetical protein
MGKECHDRSPPHTLLVPKLQSFSLPIRPTKPIPKTYAGSDESRDIGAVQRLYTRLAQIIQEHHRSQQRQH